MRAVAALKRSLLEFARRKPALRHARRGCTFVASTAVGGFRPLLPLRPSALLFLFFCAAVAIGIANSAFGASATALFEEAIDSYRADDFTHAAMLFRESVRAKPSAGALQNLGSTEWRNRRTGYSVLAWEQSLWLNPFNAAAQNNLRFVRKVSQLESPELAWYEVVSTWLPVNWWAWIAGLSFWFAVGIGALPGLLRFRKAAWQQALAAFSLAIFLLSVPAHFGVATRSRLGFILQKETPLRLTPTEEAQYLDRLQAGSPARLQRTRGNYVLLQSNRMLGWVQKDQFGLICPEK